MRNLRQKRILEIISSSKIERQQDIVNILRSEGFNVTQATVSRDIKQLKVNKTGEKKGEAQHYIPMENDDDENAKYVRILKDTVLLVDTAGNFLVIKTVSGMAMAVAAVIDGLKLEGIVGCIAGDDTIFCAIKTDKEAANVAEKMKKIISE